MWNFLQKNEPVEYVKLDNLEIKLSDFIEVMEELEDSDFLYRVIIYNSDLEKWLTANHYVYDSYQGYYKTEKFDIEWPKIENRYYNNIVRNKN